MKNKKNIRKILKEYRKKLLEKGDYKGWFLLFKYVKVGFDK